LRGRYARDDCALPAPASRGFFRFAVVVLLAIGASYIYASAARWPVSIVALGGGLLLLAGAAWYRRLDWCALRRELAWPIFLFIGAMLVLVRGVENLGLTQAFGALLLEVGGHSALGVIVAATLGSALGANLVNNVPMALIMTSAIRAQPGLPAPRHAGVIYATIIGADLGPNLTTVGLLATMLWLLILRRKGLDVSARQYFMLGLTVAPLMLLGGALLLWLQL
jgi:arsenical pump membrane protein